jgi:hypothetical protein
LDIPSLSFAFILESVAYVKMHSATDPSLNRQHDQESTTHFQIMSRCVSKCFLFFGYAETNLYIGLLLIETFFKDGNILTRLYVFCKMYLHRT